MQLTKSFSLEDFTKSATAARLKIDNTPSREIIERLKVLAGVLEYLQGVLGLPLTISSGFRCVALNKAIGGVETSGHCKGYACDIQTSISPEDLQKAILSTGVKFDQLIIEYSGNKRWIHYSADPRNRRQTFKIVK